MLHELLSVMISIMQQHATLLSQLETCTNPTVLGSLASYTQERSSMPQVPAGFAIDKNVFRIFKGGSLGPGNFTAKLTERYFPELFGKNDLRFHYRWFYGGLLNTNELCLARKEAIKTYLVMFFPRIQRGVCL